MSQPLDDKMKPDGVDRPEASILDRDLADAFEKNRARFARMVRLRLDPRLIRRVDPEDVLQEAYIEAGKRRRHFRPAEGSAWEESLFVWLRLIVQQTLVDVHRRHLGAEMRSAGREVSLRIPRGAMAQSESLSLALVDKLPSPSSAARRAEQIQRVLEIFEKMNPIDREVLALRHFEELSNGEVAAVLGITQKAASIRYVRAMERLRLVLGGESSNTE